jgi:LPS sulfotransferase NodH
VAQGRPDAIDLIGPDFDRASAHPAERTLIICSAPRTGSYELCRFLLAAGIGVPHEYFNPSYARRLGERWGFAQSPLEPSEVARYVAALRRRRGQGGVFAAKLQFPHFDGALRNRTGRDLFEGATVVHLFRSDAPAQYVSLRSALESGSWDFSGRPTTPPLVRDPKNFDSFVGQALQELDMLMGQDAGFRCLFALIGVKPIFVTSSELFDDPRAVIGKIADAVRVPVNAGELDQALALSAPYGRDRKKIPSKLTEHFKRIAFGGAG